MTILHPTAIEGQVAVLLINLDRARGLETTRVEEVRVTFEGIAGDCHSGLTRPADVRVRKQYAKDTPIRNTRQVSIVSTEDLAAIAEAMDIPDVRPEWLGANLVTAGIPDLSLLPGSSRLVFSSGASLVLDTENGPCRYPADVIETHHPGRGQAFIPAARHKRGVTGWVEKEGFIRTGDTISLHLPTQRIYEAAGA